MRCAPSAMSSSLRSFLFLPAPPAWAQATAELSGRVTDESAAVLPGVTVAATQTDTGFIRTVVTDEAGRWIMPNLPTGPLQTGSVAGRVHARYVQTGVVLQVDARPTINVALAVGNLEETVSVDAAAPLVDVRSAGISSVVEQERIVELPLQGRQVTDLIVLAGAAVETGRPNSRNFQGGVNISVAGGLQFGVAYTLDGARPQRSAEFRRPPAAVSRRAAGIPRGHERPSRRRAACAPAASVNAVTKSGTNTLHGNAFEFLRDKRFNAKSPFAAIGPDGKRFDDGLKRNQFGGTLRRTDCPRQAVLLRRVSGHQDPSDTAGSTSPSSPRAAMLAGDFTTFASPACQGRQVNLGAGFVEQSHRPGAFQSCRAQAGRASAEDHGSVRTDHLQPAGRSRRGTVRRPRRLSAEREPLGVRPLHGVARQEAFGVRHDGQRADDGESVDRQPGAVAHARRHESLRQQHGQRAAVCVQPHGRQPRQRSACSIRRVSASRPPPTCRAR